MGLKTLKAVLIIAYLIGDFAPNACGQGGRIIPLQQVHFNTTLTKHLNGSKWASLFPHRYGSTATMTDFYSFKAFVAAAEKFPLFLGEGDQQTRKRELAAFLANIAQETSGGWQGAPEGYFKWGLYFLQEKACEHGCPQYSDENSKDYPPVNGRSYHGRGPKQLSWNYNYGQFSQAYFGDKNVLLNNPDLLIQNDTLAFASAIWFWMTAQKPKPSCHDIITGKWTPTEADMRDNRLPGFGVTVNVINGGIECGTPTNSKTQYRYDYYKLFCNYFKVKPGDNIDCITQKPFNIQ